MGEFEKDWKLIAYADAIDNESFYPPAIVPGRRLYLADYFERFRPLLQDLTEDPEDFRRRYEAAVALWSTPRNVRLFCAYLDWQKIHS